MRNATSVFASVRCAEGAYQMFPSSRCRIATSTFMKAAIPQGPSVPSTVRNRGSSEPATSPSHARISAASANGPYGM